MAAEKQPEIKEAMRKWGVGVNWAANLQNKDKAAGRGKADWEEDGHGAPWDGHVAGGSAGTGLGLPGSGVEGGVIGRLGRKLGRGRGQRGGGWLLQMGVE